jgi:PAS domain S-box-containing protein
VKREAMRYEIRFTKKETPMSKPLCVLMIEDSEDDAALLIRHLTKGGYTPHCERVETAEAMRRVLAQGSFDLILCDYKLPRFSGIDALSLFKETELDIPFILVSGTIGEEVAVQALKTGADDYVMKDRLGRLCPAIERALQDRQLLRQRNQAQEEIVRRAIEWQKTFDSANDAIWILDRNHRVLRSNKAAERFFGEPYDTFIGRHCWEIVHGTAAPYPKCPVVRVKDSLRREATDLQIGDRWFEIVADPILDAEGRFDGVVHIVSDITERKQAEEELRRSEERYRNIFDNSVEGIFQSTLEGRLVKVNPAYASIFGYDSLEEMVESVTNIGTQLYVDPKDRQASFDMVEREGVIRGFECRCRRKDGAEIWISINSRLGTTPEGLVCYEGFVQDITDRKCAELSIQQTLARLRQVTGSIIDVIVMAVESRDPYTAGHQKRVAELAGAIAVEMGLPSDRIEGIRVAGVIHDLGKISIPAEILSTPRRLSEIEYSLVKTHPLTGHEILKEIDFDWPVAEMVLQHHERMDGSGYPKGLKGDEIMPEARILAVADVVESMATHRPYRPALGVEAALEEILAHRGTLFDVRTVDACISLFGERGYHLDVR